MNVLTIATRAGKFEVLSVYLPDARSYIDVREFLWARAQENQRSPH
jgi:hypothetical protein